MSSGTIRNGQFSVRRDNEESEPFLVRQIPGSPVRRGRKNDVEDKRFFVEDMSGSPLTRSRVPRVITGSRITTNDVIDPISTISSTIGQSRSAKDATDGTTIGPTTTTTTTRSEPSSSNRYATGSNDPIPSDNDDAPPSYESSIPIVPIGWSTAVATTNANFPTFHMSGNDDVVPSSTLPRELYDVGPTMEFLPIAESYQIGVESSRGKSAMRSTSPSLCPSPDSCKPAYTYQYRRIVATAPPRPRYGFDHDASITKPRHDFSYKYGAIVIAIAFVAFLMLLSLAVKFLIRNGLSR